VNKAAAAVLVGPARCLHHAIERQVVEHNDFAHEMVLSSIAWSSPPPSIQTGTVQIDREIVDDDARNVWP
jgi:hypothetical protein